MAKRRYTREEIANKAKDHVAYGWTPRPGTWDFDRIEWTDEDTAVYNEEYDKAYKAAKETGGTK